MQTEQPAATVERVEAREVFSQLRQIKVFSQLREEDAGCLGEAQVWHAPAGSSIYRDGDFVTGFWGVVEGEIRAFKKEDDGATGFFLHIRAGDSFGEVPLLTGRPAAVLSCEVVADATLISIGEEGFWKLLASCPVVRRAIMADMQRRLQNYQAFALHREKLISLGTLSAGLMHELNNPGTAAKRAAAQLRENVVRLQQISLRFCEFPWQQAQIECMKELQTHALADPKPKMVNGLEQSDAEERLAEWLEEAGVENSWKIAPTLAGIGLTQEHLDCTRHAFPGSTFSDALNWLVSLVSSMQLVDTIEQSITRVSELVMAVKKYAYNENPAQAHVIDIHDGLRSTLTILGHKLRPKDLKIDKDFDPNLPTLKSRGTGLAQVWTNLLDNAVDASPAGATIHIRTWVENGNACVGIADEGAGIPEQCQAKIFDPFFTTKPVGEGTGMGLDIAHRIVVGSYAGQISFETRPGRTEFIVRIPLSN
jgi:signal transduction histidine kinase